MNKVLHFFASHTRFIILFFLVLIGVGIYFSTRPSSAQQVETQKVKRQNLTQSLPATGTIDSTNSVDLTFLTGGKMVYLGVKKGDRVKKGQTIATLDQRTVKKNLESTLRDYSKERNTFDQAHDDNDTHKPTDAVNDKLKRILENHQHDLDKAVLSVELQDLSAEQSVLTTPISGVVVKADAKTAGVNVSPTTTFTIADADSLVFKMDIDEADIGKVKEGQAVTLILDAFPDETLDVSVDSIDFATHDTSTGGDAYTVESRISSDTDHPYRLGMNGDAEIILREISDVMTVPIASVIDDQYVYVPKDDYFEKRKVKLGIANDTDAEVLSGLNEGDAVAVDPIQAEKVKPKKFLFF